MRRLEYERRMRTVPTYGRRTADAVMVLAQVARERRRLGEEQRSLVKRMKRIEVRLSEIAATETRLVPQIRIEHPGSAIAVPSPGAMTVQY